VLQKRNVYRQCYRKESIFIVWNIIFEKSKMSMMCYVLKSSNFIHLFIGILRVMSCTSSGDDGRKTLKYNQMSLSSGDDSRKMLKCNRPSSSSSGDVGCRRIKRSQSSLLGEEDDQGHYAEGGEGSLNSLLFTFEN
jgi:hypothetical protein